MYLLGVLKAIKIKFYSIINYCHYIKVKTYDRRNKFFPFNYVQSLLCNKILNFLKKINIVDEKNLTNQYIMTLLYLCS